MVIATPADPSQVIKILDWHYQNPCPMYLRLHKAGEPSLCFSHQSLPLQLGDLIQIHPDSAILDRVYTDNVCVLAVGFIADQVATLVSSIAPSVPLYAVPLWGHPSLKKFVKNVERFKTVITVEDHVLEGGFGSFVMEAISTSGKDIRVVPISFGSDIVGKVAQERTLLTSLLYRLEKELIKLASYS
jgi:transketolase